ncbi:hypothetical protein OpiT1DRAFT_01891 [Opitutaceae bacterium TAV1]|nr:hypothetical protein OpiT1DRAFT_01891 [Opitutaceae bacterium TAV1]
MPTNIPASRPFPGGLLLACLFASALPASSAAAAGNVSPEKLAAIDACLTVIRDAQVPDGLIRLQNEGDKLWAVPYFSNIAVMGVLAAWEVRPVKEDLVLVEKWLRWYAAHQNPDGTVNDYKGTLSQYASTGDFDSTDSYASTYLQTLWRYWKATKNEAVARELLPAARKCLDAIGLTLDPRDGLTYAKPSHGVKYLMDNIEVCVGVDEGARFFEALGDLASAARAREIEKNTREGLRKFWSPKHGYYGWFGDPFDGFVFELEKHYPDGLANVFAASCITPPDEKFYPMLRESHGPASGGAYWLTVVRRLGSPYEINHYERLLIRNMPEAMKPGVGNVCDAGNNIMALLGGDAMWPQIRIDWARPAPPPPVPVAPAWKGPVAELPATSIPAWSVYKSKGDIAWDGARADLTFDIEDTGCYVQYALPFRTLADFSAVRSISFVLNLVKETHGAVVGVSLVDQDGDVWDLPVTPKKGRQEILLGQVVRNKWCFPTANGIADLDRIAGLRLQVSSTDKQVKGKVTFSGISLHK